MAKSEKKYLPVENEKLARKRFESAVDAAIRSGPVKKAKGKIRPRLPNEVCDK